jgi:hypothetical protein
MDIIEFFSDSVQQVDIRHRKLPLSNILDNMASRICDIDDAVVGEVYYNFGLKEESANDWARVPSLHRSNRCLLQLELDLW